MQHMTVEQVNRIAARIADFVEMLRITGGEPTLSPVFQEVLRIVDGLNRPLVLFTNAAWRHPRAIIDSLGACRNLDGILVSLHGHNASAYQAFTQSNYFEQVLENIRAASRAGIVVNTNTILTRHNIGHLEELRDLVLASGAQVAAFSRYYGKPVPGVTDLPGESYRYALELIDAWRREGIPVKFNNNLPMCLGGVQTQACPAGDTHCTIDPWGKVRLCNHLPGPVGDLLTQSIAEIWRSPVLDAWRRQTPEICQGCAALDQCRAGCRAHARANNLVADPLACQPYSHQPEIQPPIHHRLLPDSIVKPCFSARQEAFGYVLIQRSQTIKMGPDARPLIERLSAGQATLASIGQEFGPHALNFIGLLYDRRMVELVSAIQPQ